MGSAMVEVDVTELSPCNRTLEEGEEEPIAIAERAFWETIHDKDKMKKLKEAEAALDAPAVLEFFVAHEPAFAVQHGLALHLALQDAHGAGGQLHSPRQRLWL